MSKIDRFLLIVAVFIAASSTGDGVARGMLWMGVNETVAAVMYFAATLLAIPVYVDAVQSYRRHGWGR